MSKIATRIAAINAAIVKLTAEREKLVAEQANELTIEKLPVGTKVTVREGKADNPTHARGTVLGTGQVGKGAYVARVLIGEGINARVVTAYLSAIAISAD